MRGKIFWIAGIILCLFIICLSNFWLEPSAPQHKWQLTDVSGHLPNLQFSLIADDGKPVNENSYKGYIALLYFGFTHCPDECPVTLARLNEILNKLGKEGDHIKVLFVTIDPARDDPKTMREFINSFNSKNMVGLTGGKDDIKKLTKRYRAAYRPDKDNIIHSNAIYIFDGQGSARLIATPEDSDEKIINDLRNLRS